MATPKKRRLKPGPKPKLSGSGGKKEPAVPDQLAVTCSILYAHGLTHARIASAVGIGNSTVRRYIKSVHGYCTDMPSVDDSLLFVQTMMPKAIKALDDAMSSGRGNKDIDRGKIALSVLKSFGVIKDTMEIKVDDGRKSNEDLINELKEIFT